MSTVVHGIIYHTPNAEDAVSRPLVRVPVALVHHVETGDDPVKNVREASLGVSYDIKLKVN